MVEDIVCSIWRHIAARHGAEIGVTNLSEDLLDALNCTLSIDNKIGNAMENLAPHKSSFGLEDHRGVTSSLLHPKPFVSSVANWLDTDD